jgi:hypothetical protein
MPDIFDTLETSPKKDVFDEVEGDVFDQIEPSLQAAPVGIRVPATSISSGDVTGWLARAKKFITDSISVNPQSPIAGINPLLRTGLGALDNMGKVSSNVTRNFAMGKEMGPEILDVSEGGRPTTGNPARDTRIDLAGAALGTIAGASGLSGTGLLSQGLKVLQKGKEAKKIAQRFAELEKGAVELPKKKEIVQEARILPRGDEAIVKAKTELGPASSTIPDRIFQPTKTEVKAGRELGVQARLLPSAALREAPDPVESVKQVIRTADTPVKQNPEDVKKIASLASSPDSDKAKTSHVIGAWVRSMDNWLMDHGGSTVVEPIRKAVRDGDAWKYQWFTKVDEILGGVREGSKEAELIGRYMKGETVKGLTPELQRIGDRLRREVFEPIINQIRGDADLKGIIGEVGYIQNYFPELEKAWRSKYGEETALALVHDLKPERFKAGFFKKRTKEAKDPMLDIVSVMRAYLRGSAKTLFDVKGYAAAESALKNLPSGPGDLFREVASKYAKTFIGQPSTRGDVDAWHKLGNKIHDWYYKAFIGFNPISAGVNLTQNANTFVEVGTKHTLKAFDDVFRGNKRLEKIFKDTGVLGEFPGMEISSRLQGKVDNSLFYLFRKAEALNRKVAFYAGMHEAEAAGKKGADAIEHALNVVHKTQFTYGKSSPVQHASVPIVGQFSNYPMKQLEFLVSAVKRPEQRRRLIALMGITAAADVAAGGNISEFATDYAGQFMPGIGPGAKDLVNAGATLKGYRKTSPGQLAEDIGRRTPFIGGGIATWKTLEKALGEDK